MPDFDCSFLLTDGNRYTMRQEKTCAVSLWQISAYGMIYGESLVVSAGHHYEAYAGARRRPLWSMRIGARGAAVAQYNERRQKVASPAVTGHVGEAMALPALEAALPAEAGAAFVRLRRRSRGSGPDYLVSAPKGLWRLFGVDAPHLPEILPVEVRSRIGVDQKYPKSAESPLKAYWRDCLRAGLADRMRYGVVARVNLSPEGGQGSRIRFYLFVPDVVYDVTTGGPS